MQSASTSTSEIAILLATYNGHSFLKEQLTSFSEQTYKNWKLIASDDGSQDDTIRLLEEFKGKSIHNPISIVPGPEKGFSANFLSLLCRDDIIADYYAYADQDDIWENNKLERAINYLNTTPNNIPALYCSRAYLVDENNQPIGFSKTIKRPLHFKNALVQSVASGNTMVFNKAAYELLKKVSNNVAVFSHDWWSYLIISGSGGVVFYDPYCSLRYRQHSANLIGEKASFLSKIARSYRVLKGDFKDANNLNSTALMKSYDFLMPENKKTLDEFVAIRNSKLLKRMIKLVKSKLYRQNPLENIGLWMAVILNKM